jgi:two-component system nitrogen regulation sensor histidine kinase NtrY
VRQIAEAHGGSVSLRNREDAPGCVAEVRIPALSG